MATKKAKVKAKTRKPTPKAPAKKKAAPKPSASKKKKAAPASKKPRPSRPVAKKAAPKKPAAASKSSKAPVAAKTAKKVEAPKKAVKPEKPKAASAPSPAPAKPAVVAKPAEVSARLTSLAPKIPLRTVSKEKVLGHDFMIDLAKAIKEAVAPIARSLKGREIIGATPSGDASFELDRVAERALLQFLRTAKAPVAYYSEESGYSTFSSAQPKHLLIVDPVDGTRAAKSGFEGCVVAIASTRVIERPRVRDLDNGCVMELLGPHAFYGERGKGVRVYEDGHIKKPRLSANQNLESLVWSMTVPARPAELIFPTAARLIDLSSLKGGFFACNSTSFSLTRLITGQMDACIDIANRYMRDIPEAVKDQFINAGRGNILGIAPYDIVAALVIAEEAGAVVTDAYGNRFDEVLLLDSSELNQLSVIAASNVELHAKLLNYFDTRIKQFETILARRAGLSAAQA